MPGWPHRGKTGKTPRTSQPVRPVYENPRMGMKKDDLLERLGRVAAEVVGVDRAHVVAAVETLEIVARAYGVLPPGKPASAAAADSLGPSSDCN